MMEEPMYPSGRAVDITLDGRVVTAREGEPLAAVFLRLDAPTRLSHPSARPRAPYCMMGVCYDCVVTIAGRGRIRSCQETVREGMIVERVDRPVELT